MRPDRVNPETPDEIIAMIKIPDSPLLQEQLRSLCRDLIDIFSTLVRSLPAQVEPMVIDIGRTNGHRYRSISTASHLGTIPLKSKQPSAGNGKW
jgi:hypothetical protein